MNEDLKRHPEQRLLYFTKVYVYTTNTKKPWNKIDLNDKKLEWFCAKWFCISKDILTENMVKNHINNCPELKESIDDLSKKNSDPSKNWKYKSEWYHIYPEVPLKDEGELKLLINTIGLRMLHFI